jgi:hypothetical protein
MWQRNHSTAAYTSAPLRMATLRLRRLATQLATKKTGSALKSRCRGTSVSPLDKTYHGGPQT